MSGDDPDEREEEYAGWELPGQSTEGDDSGPAGDMPKAGDTPDAEDDRVGPPPELRDALYRDRIRDRLGVSPQQWYVIETILLVLPYPLFVLVYVTFPVNETLFLVVTLAYSLFAMYVGLLS